MDEELLLLDSDDEALNEISQTLTDKVASSTSQTEEKVVVVPPPKEIVVPKSLKGLNTILVHPDQRKNELLKHLGSISYIFTSSIEPAHYVIYDSCCALMVTVRFHISFPDYIPERICRLQNKYKSKLLILVIDHLIYESVLKELTIMCARTNFTLLIAFDYKDAARHVINFRINSDCRPDIIMGLDSGKNQPSSASKVVNQQSLVDALTTVKSINRTDAANLLNTFKTMDNLIRATSDQLMICPGMSDVKARRLHALFRRPFKKSTEL